VSPTILASFISSFHLSRPSSKQNKTDPSHPQLQTPRSYKDKVKDYNFGSLIRTDARDEYGEKNTIFGALRILVAYIDGVLTRGFFFSFSFFVVTRIQVCIYIPSLFTMDKR
jgi:hypothetical protein